MKKIGIMSMQRVKNYGSFWQAYGLREMINNIIPCNVEFVDYVPGKPIESKNGVVDQNMKFDLVHLFIKKAYGGLFYIKYNFLWLPKYLNISRKMNYSKDCDLTVIGSDEVFNCTQSGSKVGFSEDLFGKNRNNVVSYAASFGFTTYNRLKEYKLIDDVKALLLNFNSISVRDKNSYNIVKKLINKNPDYNLDPVLVSNINELKLPRIKMKNYIIVYAYTGRINSIEKEAIKSFARKHSKKIISLGYYHDFVDKVIVCNPYEVLAYFKQCDYVITDTFHGTIFSIIFKKQFVSFIRESNKEKLFDLLDCLLLKSRCLDDACHLEELITKKIDYTETDIIIKKEKKKAREYLLKCLG